MLLRHAYVEVENEDFRLLAGQTWDVISPLNPGMLMYSVGWEAGNIGYRRAQFRAERYVAISDTQLLTLQGSIDENSFPTPSPVHRAIRRLGRSSRDARPGPSAIARVPMLGRSLSAYPAASPDAIRLQLRLDQPRQSAALTWSLDADLYVPITHRFGVQGEFLPGRI